MLRLYGIPESEIAATLRAAEARASTSSALEITTCLRRGEVEVVTRYEPDGADGLRALRGSSCASVTPRTLFSDDGSTVDEQVLALLLDQARRRRSRWRSPAPAGCSPRG